MTSYSDKLKDPRWQKMRLKVLERDEFTCRHCQSGGITLHVHHQYYEHGKDPWDYNANSLLTLCEDCHESEKSYGKEKTELFYREFYNSFFESEDLFEIACSLHSAEKWSYGDAKISTDIIIELFRNDDFRNKCTKLYLKVLKDRKKNAKN